MSKKNIIYALILVLIAMFIIKLRPAPYERYFEKGNYYKYKSQPHSHSQTYPEYIKIARDYYWMAVDKAKEALNKNPKDNNALYFLHSAYIELGKDTDANNLYLNYKYIELPEKGLLDGIVTIILYCILGLLILLFPALLIWSIIKNIKRRKFAQLENVVICPECEAPVNVDDKICGNCGTEFEEDEDEEPDASNGNKYLRNKRIVYKTIIVVLAIILSAGPCYIKSYMTFKSDEKEMLAQVQGKMIKWGEDFNKYSRKTTYNYKTITMYLYIKNVMGGDCKFIYDRGKKEIVDMEMYQ